MSNAKQSKHATIGYLIERLSRFDQDEELRYDFVYMRPTKCLASYRGYYDQLALGYTNSNSDTLTVGDLKKMLEDSIGKTYTGYKGGEYTMDDTTCVWVANSGEAGGTAIIDIEEIGCYVTIVTKKID